MLFKNRKDLMVYPADDELRSNFYGKMDFENIEQLRSRYMSITLEKQQLLRFKELYHQKYNQEFFKNPFSAMMHKLRKDNISFFHQVQSYAKENPNSRSARILARME